MLKKKLIKSVTIFLFALIPGFFTDSDIFSAGKMIDETSLITEDLLKFVKPSPDFRNYFMVQSIDDTTVILIGNFVGSEKMITLITDNGSDNSIDNVVDYFPDTKKYKRGMTSTSQFFKSNIAELKKEIIEGIVFEKYYSYQMKSLPTLKIKLAEDRDISNFEGGVMVKLYDPERSSTPMSEFYFRLKDDRYDLMFKTNYYKLYNTNIQPPISFSVYCRNSKDPVIVEYVKELQKLRSR